MRGFRPRLSYANVVSTVALFAALGGGGLAAIAATGGNRVIHACYVKKTGNLRVNAGNKKCGKKESALSFNQQGPRGAAGVAGVPGTPGSTGARGADGPAVDSSAFLRDSCPSGTALIGVRECIETSGRTPDTWANAGSTCAGLGRRLPPIPELESASAKYTLAAASEWSSANKLSGPVAIEVAPTGYPNDADPT
jgi:hypothetical protein